MKKSIIITLILALFISIATSVNAVETREVTPHLTLDNSKVEQGKEVTVSVSFTNKETGADETAVMADFNIVYDPTALEYVEGSANTSAENVQNADGTLRLLYFANDEKELTCKFKVIGEKGTSSEIKFVPTQITTTGTVLLKAEEVASTIEINKEVVNEPNDDNAGSGSGNQSGDVGSNNGGDKTEEPKKDDEKPTSIPQTGINYIIIAGVMVAVVAGVVLVKKFNK